MLTKTEQQDIDNWFSYHPPTESQLIKYNKLRDDLGKNVALILYGGGNYDNAISDLKEYIEIKCPDGIEKDFALEAIKNILPIAQESGILSAVLHLRICVIMAANAAIACNE